MSTLQHTSQLRERATRRLVLIVLIVTVAAGAIAAGIVAIASGGSSPVNGSAVVQGHPMYASGALERGLSRVKAAHAASAGAQTAEPSVATPQTPGHRP